MGSTISTVLLIASLLSGLLADGQYC
jgi:hypothetical protein